MDLNADLIGRHDKHKAAFSEPAGEAKYPLLLKLQSGISSLFPGDKGGKDEVPSMIDVLAASINIMQVRVTRSRLAGEPADVLVAPRLAKLALMDFHRAAEAIEEGRKVAQDVVEDLKSLLAHEAHR